MPPPQQLALRFPHHSDYEPESFIAAEANAAALNWLDTPSAWPGLRLALHGEPGSGKTHLLHLFARRTGAVLRAGWQFSSPPEEQVTAPLAIDDADQAPDEAALLHWLNAAQEAGQPVLLAAGAAPSRWPAALPDLASRLRATTAVALGAPDEALRRALLAQLIAARQLRVDDQVQAYLLIRLPRDCGSLREAAARLDRASLAAGRRVSRHMAASVLEAMQQDLGNVAP